MDDVEELLDPSEDNRASDKKFSKRQYVNYWEKRINSANASYKKWADRFKVEMLYQYYEGFQWFFEVDENNRPYVINMIYSTIETKLPNIIFDNPQFSLRARPVGIKFDEDSANSQAQVKEDILNYICARSEFGLSDKHELAVLDAFIGFGVIETGQSRERHLNPYITEGKVDPLDQVYTKRIPFDQFRVSALANWDLSEGRWKGYFEYVPWDRLEKFSDKLLWKNKVYDDGDEVATVDTISGKIMVASDVSSEISPPSTCKIWHLWDLDNQKFILYAPDDARSVEDSLLCYESYEYDPISTIRMGKRRRGWYPYPPVWNWISPQDELNDTRQAQRLHRKRFTRKYMAMAGAFDNQEEQDKFLYGPDGTIVTVTRMDGIKAIEDAPLDPVDSQSLGLTYDDFNRISGTPDEQRGIPVSGNRTTATQSNIMNQRSMIRESKDTLRVGDFLCSIGRNILKSARKVNRAFWIKSKLNNEGFLGAIQKETTKWTRIAPSALKDSDLDVDLSITSISPINQQQDKQAFMEFLAVITQYEVLSLSPALIREAAYRVGYKNAAVLDEFQKFASLAAIGRQIQLQNAAQVQVPGQGGIQPNNNGQLPQQQVAASTPPDMEQLNNLIFNRGAVQQ